MTKIPNILSVIRILLSPILFFVDPFSPSFWVVYSVCGFSDMMDGFIARKTNSTSRLGAILDSIADIVFLGTVFVVLLPIIFIPKDILIWIAVIALIRVVSLLLAYLKYHTFGTLHTYANKVTGFILFCFPYLYNSIHIDVLGSLICLIASLSAIEELVIHLRSKELSRNVKGIWRCHR